MVLIGMYGMWIHNILVGQIKDQVYHAIEEDDMKKETGVQFSRDFVVV